jgi:hypothetical protein
MHSCVLSSLLLNALNVACTFDTISTSDPLNLVAVNDIIPYATRLYRRGQNSLHTETLFLDLGHNDLHLQMRHEPTRMGGVL